MNKFYPQAMEIRVKMYYKQKSETMYNMGTGLTWRAGGRRPSRGW